MNAEDKFEVRYQEIVDAHTGATITLGSHAGSGHRYMRIAVPDLLVGSHDSKTKTSTITFGPDGQALKILPHIQSPTGFHAGTSGIYIPPAESEAREEPADAGEFGSAEEGKLDKYAKRAKK